MKASNVLLVMSVPLRSNVSRLLKFDERKYLISMASSIFMHSSRRRQLSPLRYFDSASPENTPDCKPMKLRLRLMMLRAFSESTSFSNPKSLIFWHLEMLSDLKPHKGASASAYSVSLEANVLLMSSTSKLEKFYERRTSPMPLSVMAKQLAICSSRRLRLEMCDFLASSSRNSSSI